MADDEQLYDILIPPGVPRKLIIEISKKYDVKVVERLEKIKFANMEGDERNLLAFRGKLDVIQKVEQHLLKELDSFVKEK